MKKSSVFLSMMFILSLNQGLINGANIEPVERAVGKLNISIDPRVEILVTIQLLSNYPLPNRNFPHNQDILKYFEPFSSHEAVTLTDSLRRTHGFSYDAPVAYMMYLTQLPELEQLFAYSDYLLGRSGRGDNLERYRKSIKQFAEISNFEAFWNSKIPFYKQILVVTIADMGVIDLVKTMEDYFNETRETYNVIIAPAFGGNGHGYASNIPATEGNIVYAFISTSNMKDNIPYLKGNNLLGIVWHEFGHSFVNPLTDKYIDRVMASDMLFVPIKEKMSRQAYPQWIHCVNEHIIRAIEIRLAELHVGVKQAKKQLSNEKRKGFIYIEPLVEKLKYFENQRDESCITFSEFYPELLNTLDSLQTMEYWKQVNTGFRVNLNTEAKITIILIVSIIAGVVYMKRKRDKNASR